MSLNVVLLGLVSLITDASTELMAPILPLFIASLGGGGLAIGLIGGLGDGASCLLRLMSGYVSDRVGRRKPLIALGYAVSSTAKLLMPLSSSWLHVLGLRVVERAGKGIRTPPRDALIAESSTRTGRAFGLHRSLDTVGAIIGSLTAFALVGVIGLGLREALLIAGIVAFTALIPLIPVIEVGAVKVERGLLQTVTILPGRLKSLLPIASTFAGANVSYMFLLLRAGQAYSGWLGVATPLGLYVLFNAVYASLSYPMGSLADRVGKARVLALGYLAGSAAFALMASTPAMPVLVAAFTVYGLCHSMVEGVERALIADVSGQLKGSGLGLYHASTGASAIVGNAIAGLLWDTYGPTAPFTYASTLALASCIALALWARR